MSALYDFDGARYVPSDYTVGPWRADAQHGGPPAALLGALCEELVEPDEVIVRISVELVRAVPLSPLGADATRERISRRVHHVRATLRDGDRRVATAMALVLTGGELPAPRWSPAPAQLAVPGPQATRRAPDWISGAPELAFHRDGLEHRFVGGDFERPGPALDWVRLTVPVVAGREPSGLERVLGVADVASGISSVYGFDDGVGLINADLTVALHGEPLGEWFLLDATTHVAETGTGLAVTRVSDSRGPVAVATQSLLATRFTASGGG